MTYLTYRVTFITSGGKEKTLPVMASSALKAKESLIALGYDVHKATHSFPST